VDYVIAVGHLGVDEQSEPWRSTAVIANTTGIDAFIDGHSHTVMGSQTVANMDGDDVLLTQTGTKLANIGRMVIKSDGTITAELISGYDQQDETTLTYIQGIESEFAGDLAQVVGSTDVALTVNDPATGKRRVRSGETNLGDLCADAYRYVLGNGETGADAGPADVAFVTAAVSGQHRRRGHHLGEVIAVHPFNTWAAW
jgi:2',3'-cyclic-nucleotide 2'-phosphodiesterase (5'-nucleotidase family)